MSVRVMTLVFHSRLPPGPKYVMLALADWAADDGTRIYPKIDEELAPKTSLSRATLYRLLDRLKSMELLHEVRASRRGAAREYRIDLVKLCEWAPELSSETENGVSQRDKRGLNLRPQHGPLGSQSETKGSQPETKGSQIETPHIYRQKPSETVKGEGAQRVRRTRWQEQDLPADWRAYAIEKGLPATSVPEVWASFQDYWIATGKPMADWKRTWQRWVREELARGRHGRSRNGAAAQQPHAGLRDPAEFDRGIWDPETGQVIE